MLHRCILSDSRLGLRRSGAGMDVLAPFLFLNHEGVFGRVATTNISDNNSASKSKKPLQHTRNFHQVVNLA